MYQTRCVKIESGEEPIVQEAGRLLRQGELVAFPTETVYGLGCNGLDGEAAKKVFAAKGRPADNPLILHIADLAMMEDLVEGYDQLDPDFLQHFWPGPMTLIFQRKPIVPDAVTGGGETVAIRFPSHPLAQKVILAADRPLGAPSANLSGRPSPTTAKDVFQDMAGRIPLILDGGPSQIGIESTVIDMTQEPAMILRPGFYTEADLAPYLPGIRRDRALVEEGVIPKSPGQKYKHYAPQAEMEVVVGPAAASAHWLLDRLKAEQAQGRKVGILAFVEDQEALAQTGESFDRADCLILQGSRTDLRDMARDLFTHLRDFDRQGVEVILASGVASEGFGSSIMNRMRKAASGRVHVLEEPAGSGPAAGERTDR